MNRRLRVDPVACDAFGHCAEILPELISLDEWGYPVVGERPVTAELSPYVDQAIRTCPRRALFLENVPATPSPTR